jgi:cytochrome c-type biogenesis protein CcmH/NrfG
MNNISDNSPRNNNFRHLHLYLRQIPPKFCPLLLFLSVVFWQNRLHATPTLSGVSNQAKLNDLIFDNYTRKLGKGQFEWPSQPYIKWKGRLRITFNYIDKIPEPASSLTPNFNRNGLAIPHNPLASSILSLLADLTLHPNNLEVYLDLSSAFLDIGSSDMALEILSRAHQVNGYSSEIALKEIDILMHIEDIEATKDRLSKLLSVDPMNPTARMYLGDIYLLEGNLDMALEDYTEAVRLNGLSVELASRLGDVWLGKRDYLMAIVYYRYWASQSHDDPDAHYYLGLALVERGRFEEARISLQRSADLYLGIGDTQGSENAYATLETMQEKSVAE